MEIMEAIYTRRSIRMFTDTPVPDETLYELVKAGAAAPSGGNAQPWSFLIVHNPERVQALRAISPGIIGQPQAVIVICLDTSRSRASSETHYGAMVWMDIGAAMQNILLAAHEKGLGACAIGSFHEQGVAKLLNLPESLTPVLQVVVGVPRKIPVSPKKRPLDEICFLEEVGNAHG
jgi:albonoursin synthase